MTYIDIRPVLDEWPYEPDKISVRKIIGPDGRARLQMRVELGILQMEAEGRPDGYRPHGHQSLLHYHQDRLVRHEKINGTALGFGLSGTDCYELRLEASLFYRRYIALFVLEEFAAVFADTSHSLAIFDFCRTHALEAADRAALEDFRAYVLMMDARARAYHALDEGEPASALAHVNRGMINIRAHLEAMKQPDAEKTSEELKILRKLAQELTAQVPADSIIVTRKALRDAIEQERFEDAARLRDTLNKLLKRR